MALFCFNPKTQLTTIFPPKNTQEELPSCYRYCPTALRTRFRALCKMEQNTKELQPSLVRSFTIAGLSVSRVGVCKGRLLITPTHATNSQPSPQTKPKTNTHKQQTQDILDKAFAALDLIKAEDLVQNDAVVRANTRLHYAVRVWACVCLCICICVYVHTTNQTTATAITDAP